MCLVGSFLTHFLLACVGVCVLRVLHHFAPLHSLAQKLPSQDLEAVLSQGWALATSEGRGFALLSINKVERRHSDVERLYSSVCFDMFDGRWYTVVRHCATNPHPTSHDQFVFFALGA